MGLPSSDLASTLQRRRSAALAALCVVTTVVGALAGVADRGAAPTPCLDAALRQGVLVCDGHGDPPRARAWLAGGKLDVNTATVGDLALISGVGPALATAIVTTRTERGRFASLDELDEVKGIGPKTLEKLRRFLTVR